MLKRNNRGSIILTLMLMAVSVFAQEDQAKKTVASNSIFNTYVHAMNTIFKGGVSVDWSLSNNRLLVTKKDVTRYYSIYSITPEGYSPKCLTLAKDKGKGNVHNGDASWHPKGEHIIFCAQNYYSNSYKKSEPGSGLNCNVWLGKENGSAFWQLTFNKSSKRKQKGVLNPYFSHDGKKVVWCGNTGEYTVDSAWGKRAIYLADLAVVNKTPKLINVQELTPGATQDFYEVYGFTPNNKYIIFSGNLSEGQNVLGMDLYVMDIESGKFINLTNSPNVWDRYAAISPDGNIIAWMSSEGQPIGRMGTGVADWVKFIRGEIWLYDLRTKQKKQLTFFNSFGHEHQAGRRAFITDCSWAPDGKRLAVCLNYEGYETGSQAILSEIRVLTLGQGKPTGTVVNEDDRNVAPQQKPVNPVTPRQATDRKARPNTPINW